MTIGISQEDLIVRLGEVDRSDIRLLTLLTIMISECKELNPWLPIESAPLNRRIKLFNTAAKAQVVDCIYTKDFRQYYSHWQELPENPKND